MKVIWTQPYNTNFHTMIVSQFSDCVNVDGFHICTHLIQLRCVMNLLYLSL